MPLLHALSTKVQVALLTLFPRLIVTPLHLTLPTLLQWNGPTGFYILLHLVDLQRFVEGFEEIATKSQLLYNSTKLGSPPHERIHQNSLYKKLEIGLTLVIKLGRGLV